MSQPLPRFRDDTDRHSTTGRPSTSINAIVSDSEDRTITTVARATLPGDSRRLRGIPCIAPGVQGAPNPLTLIIAAENRARRNPAPSDAIATRTPRRTAQTLTLAPPPESEPLTA